jgi:hypothetical protein
MAQHSIAVLEYSNVSGFGTPQQSTASAVSPATTPNITVLNTGSAVVMAYAMGSTGSVSPGAGATTRLIFGGGIPPFVEEYTNKNQGDVVSPSLTFTGGTATYSTIAFELKASIPTVTPSSADGPMLDALFPVLKARMRIAAAYKNRNKQT